MTLLAAETLAQNEPDFASVAALIGEPARAMMLSALMSGLALPAGELAEIARISPQTASSHLQKLLEGRLLVVETQGRHRYYRIATPAVAHALEALMVLAPTRQKKPLPSQEICYARSCYNHLAGWLGVLLCQTMQTQGWLHLASDGLMVSALGKAELEKFGVKTSNIKTCLDWTERQHHLSGEVGAALLVRFLELGWLVRFPNSRALRLTTCGRQGLQAVFGLDLR
jgi:DNA-binding transcriptional ArsR family regulator